MKKLTAIFFFMVYLLSTTEAHQLLKLPVIFQHFAEHRQENKHITFLQFLDMHYMHGSPRDKDYDRDMQLPFKTSGECVASVAPAFVPLLVQVSIQKPAEITVEKPLLRQINFTPSSYCPAIWQPPKSC